MEERGSPDQIQDIFDSRGTSTCCFVSSILLAAICLLQGLSTGIYSSIYSLQSVIALGLAAIVVAILFVGLQIYRVGFRK